MNLQTFDLTPRIGTEIKADRRALLCGTHATELMELLEQRGVLTFRGLFLDDQEQLAFSKTFGAVREEGIYKVTLDKKVSDTADLIYGTFCWHIDGTTDATKEVPSIPNRASMLSPRKLSDVGGQTEFANLYAAYEDLPASDKELVDKLKAVHMMETIQRHVFPNPTESQLQRWRAIPTKVHPLVWTHKSGRKSLVPGLTATRIENISSEESQALISKLQLWASQPQYVYSHHWQMGDVLIWNNTGVMHRVIPYPLDSGRVLHRTTLAGEEALV